MFRELASLLDELHDGLVAIQAREGMQLASVEMTLPVELRPVLRDGGCVLLAEFPRSTGVDSWTPVPSRLVLAWGQGDPAAAPEATP